jgi:hypothetical protein
MVETGPPHCVASEEVVIGLWELRERHLTFNRTTLMGVVERLHTVFKRRFDTGRALFGSIGVLLSRGIEERVDGTVARLSGYKYGDEMHNFQNTLLQGTTIYHC